MNTQSAVDIYQNPGSIFDGMEIIHVVTRADLLNDGALTDITKNAAEGGFKFPAAATAALMADIEALPEDSFDSADARLYDVCFMGAQAGRGVPYLVNVERYEGHSHSTVVYELHLPVKGGLAPDEEGYCPYRVKCVCGPSDDGTPCLTFMKPNED